MKDNEYKETTKIPIIGKIGTPPTSAQFVDTYFPAIDGVVRTVDNYAKRLDQMSKCIVVAPRVGDGYIDEFSYNTMRSKSFRLMRGYYMPAPDISWSMMRKIRSQGLEIFHAHSPFTLGHFARRESKRQGIPLVATFHSKYYDDFLRMTGNALLSELLTDYVVRFYNNADAVWTVGTGTAKTLREYGYKGDIRVIDNGTDIVFPENYIELIDGIKIKFSIPEEKRILLFVGQQRWDKNLKLVLDTLRILNSNEKKYHLLSVGDGYDEENIRRYAENIGVKSETSFLGKISDREELAGIYLTSDLFFFPSMYDNAPLVVREAAAMQKPSMLLNGSNAADKVTPDLNGFVCEDDPMEAAGKINAIFNTPGMLEKCGYNASRTIAVEWSVIIPQVIEGYREAIDKLNKHM